MTFVKDIVREKCFEFNYNFIFNVSIILKIIFSPLSAKSTQFTKIENKVEDSP